MGANFLYFKELLTVALQKSYRKFWYLYLAVGIFALMPVVTLFVSAYLAPFGGINTGSWRDGLITNLRSYVHEITNTWDSIHYRTIVENGYSEQQAHLFAFFPLFPVQVWLMNLVLPFGVGLAMISASFVNYIFLTTVLYLFISKYVTRFGFRFDLKKVLPVALLLPFTFFYVVPYTEALYLSLLILCFYMLFFPPNWKIYWLIFSSLLLGFLLGLARSQAVLVAGTIFFYWVVNYIYQKRPLISFWTNNRSALMSSVSVMLGVTLGTTLFFYYGYLESGDFFISANVQKLWGREFNWQIWEPVWHDISFFLSSENMQSQCRGDNHCELSVFYTLSSIIISIALCVILLRKFPRNPVNLTLIAFSLIGVLFPLTSGSTGSINRYVITLPVYWLFLSLLLSKLKGEAYTIVVCVLLVVQVLMMAVFGSHGWVG